MTTLLAATTGAMLVGGIVLFLFWLRPVEPSPTRPRFTNTLANRWKETPERTRRLLVGGLALGALVAVLTSWVVAIVAIPLAAVGLPGLLSNSEEKARIARLEAMAEWTRGLAGVLGAGVGLRQALEAMLGSTPPAIWPEVRTLVGRLQARWRSEDALRAFADQLDDPTGDLMTAYLILGARRGGSLAAVLRELAQSVAADVAARRQIEADRAKPRGAMRWVTIITAGGLLFFSMTGSLAGYGGPLGQLALAVLLGLYAATLLWMRRLVTPKPVPRIIGAGLRRQQT